MLNQLYNRIPCQDIILRAPSKSSGKKTTSNNFIVIRLTTLLATLLTPKIFDPIQIKSKPVLNLTRGASFLRPSFSFQTVRRRDLGSPRDGLGFKTNKPQRYTMDTWRLITRPSRDRGASPSDGAVDRRRRP